MRAYTAYSSQIPQPFPLPWLPSTRNIIRTGHSSGELFFEYVFIMYLCFSDFLMETYCVISPLLITKGQDMLCKVKMIVIQICYFLLHAKTFSVNYFILK
jgi:hypothetical protein